MQRKIKVYIAGPFTNPCPIQNTNNAILLGSKLWDKGFIPFIPHLAMFWDFLDHRSYEEWLEYGLYWISSCDALYRIEGYSPGADREVEYAEKIGVSVFYSISSLEMHFSELFNKSFFEAN